jgi:hypothetical protein
MKTILSIFKILFLSLLLAVNVVGFHYYFQPAKVENLKYIPTDSKFVFSINLKSISGKLLNEFLFNSDDFEKQILTNDEKQLVLENSTYGIDPFGWVSFFSFPFESRMIQGLSLNLESSTAFRSNVEKSSTDSWKVDDILIYKNEKSTIFLFDKVAVVLFEAMEEELAGDIAVKYLQNQENELATDNKNDFFVSISKSIFEKSTFKNFFRLVPDFAEGLYLEGNFDKGLISMNGFVKMKSGIIKDGELKFENPKISKNTIDPFLFHFEGMNTNKIINKYLAGLFSEDTDTSNMIKEFLGQEISSIKYSVKNFSISTNIFSKQGMMPQYVSEFMLLNNKLPIKDSIDLVASLRNTSFQNPNKITATFNGKAEVKNTFAYFYLNPKKFIDEADFNFVIKSFVDPLIVFEEIILKAEKVKKDKLFFKGETTFFDREAHSLIQLRLLFKNLTSLI